MLVVVIPGGELLLKQICSASVQDLRERALGDYRFGATGKWIGFF